MSDTRYVSTIDLAFGDSGKGLFTDFLVRERNAGLVIRYNGGAQAGHNVVLPGGRHHTFSQFGAGSFVANTKTLLAANVVVHPGAMRLEAAALACVGVPHALSRLLIDARCRVTTPFHQAAGRLREHARGANPHGTCGVGVGETVAFALAHPEHCLRFGDLAQRARAREKLHAIQALLASELATLMEAPDTTHPAHDEWAMLRDATLCDRWLAQIEPIVSAVRAQPQEALELQLRRETSVVFEGAQGALLDEWRGFHPHTTWSSINTDAVESVLRDLAIDARVEHLGVLRAYATRHGAGPFPTHDVALDQLPEPHNSAHGWQGTFRCGHPDGVLLRYALDCVGALDALAISHLDVFERIPQLRWNTGYRLEASPASLSRLPLGGECDLAHQCKLTQWLRHAKPLYDASTIEDANDLIARVERESALTVRLRSYGNTHAHVVATRRAA